MIGLLGCSGFVPVANLFRRVLIAIENILNTVLFGIFHSFLSGKLNCMQGNNYGVYFVSCLQYLILRRTK